MGDRLMLVRMGLELPCYRLNRASNDSDKVIGQFSSISELLPSKNFPAFVGDKISDIRQVKLLPKFSSRWDGGSMQF